MQHPIIIIDSLNFFTRHFVVNPTMSRQGQQIGGFVGFLKGLKLLTEKLKPKRVIVVWEGGGSARRRAIFPDYKHGSRPQKLNRYYDGDIPDTYENRDFQIKMTIEALKHVPVQQIYVSDCEADDVIGYMCRHLFPEDPLIVVSSDKDLYQLIDDRVTQWSPGQKKFITPQEVHEKFGVWPVNMCVARSFVGDPSDSIPGVEGAGFKTMTKRFPLLSEKSSLMIQDVLDEASRLSETKAGAKVQVLKNILEAQDIVRRNWKLMHLDIANLSGDQIKKINDSVSSYSPKKNKMELMRLFVRQGIQDFDVDSFFMSLSAPIT
jgi:DNA polymerase-1